ncbi:MAG: polysaccharide deacetylase family protein [Patescibacteria group bacterium]
MFKRLMTFLTTLMVPATFFATKAEAFVANTDLSISAASQANILVTNPNPSSKSQVQAQLNTATAVSSSGHVLRAIKSNNNNSYYVSLKSNPNSYLTSAYRRLERSNVVFQPFDGNTVRWVLVQNQIKPQNNLNLCLQASAIGELGKLSLARCNGNVFQKFSVATPPSFNPPPNPNPTPTPTPTPTNQDGFTRGMVSVEFDDGWNSVYKNALPILDKYGIKTTQYIVSKYTAPDYAYSYMTPAQIKDWRSKGHFIGSHSEDHSDLSTLTLEQLDLQLKNSKEYLSTLLNEDIQAFVTPYCNSSAAVEEVARKYYAFSRDCDMSGTEGGYLVSKSNFKPYHLTSKIVEKGTTTVQINQWLTEAKAQNKWLILVYHRIDESGGNWAMTPTEFDAHMNVVRNHGIPIVPTLQAFKEIKAQIK